MASSCPAISTRSAASRSGNGTAASRTTDRRSLLALDPDSGKVYAFAEGASDYIELRRVAIDHDNDVDPQELADRFQEAVEAFDSTSFADEESQWNLSMEELEQGIW
ncbi:hypothetical protein [Streptomyces sp. NPDC006459]|uniref:hypothetical protein n=1 Tax=Streptomyces sp. NPDC006459 TaxID=3154303 RepID=UPI0033BBB51F